MKTNPFLAGLVTGGAILAGIAATQPNTPTAPKPQVGRYQIHQITIEATPNKLDQFPILLDTATGDTKRLSIEIDTAYTVKSTHYGHWSWFPMQQTTNQLLRALQ